MLDRIARLTTGRYIDAFVFLAGALTALAFAPFQFFALAVIAPAALFLCWCEVTPRRAAWRGFLYGAGLFGVGVSWVYVSLHTYGFMPAPLAGFTVLLFVAGLAAFPAAVGWAQARFAHWPLGLHFALVVPALWVLFEWVRGWFLTGFPWLNLGYSQSDSPIAGLAPWSGVYAMSFAVAVTAGLLASAVIDRTRAVWYLSAGVLLWVVSGFAGGVQWVQPAGAPLQVALVQANVPIAIKWSPSQREAIVDRYVTLSEPARAADLIVWPEAAIPGAFSAVANTLVPRLQAITRGHDTTFLIGAVERDARTRAYYNSVYAVGVDTSSYRKQHLVPFGEFLPLPVLFGWLIDHLHIPMSNFSRGSAGQPLLRAAGQPLGVSVCYEDAFGEEIIQALPAATLLINVSEDSWFGDSFAPHQRLQMARIRAREAGRWMLRAANTGPSAIINHHGDVVARSAQFTPQVLSAAVQPTSGLTPYARYGNVPIIALVFAIVAIGILPTLRKVPAKSEQSSN
jgi:apolipoprotein N-acyltransferase